MKPSGRRSVAALEAIRWLSIPSRVGGIEQLQAVIGHDSEGGRCEIRVTGSETTAVDAGGNETPISPDEVVSRLMDGGFTPTHVRLRRDATERLFMSAMRAVERATKLESEARTELDSEDLGAPAEEGGIDWKLFNVIGYLRDAVPPALQSIVFAVATAEAQVNAWGQWTGKEDNQPIAEKCKSLARSRGCTLSLGRGEGQWFMEAISIRHDIVHAKPGTEERDITVVDHDSLALRARRSCVGVRHVLIDLATCLDEPPPRYLAMCPLDPDDIAAWHSAVVLSGVRDDPVFGPGRENPES